MTPAVLGEPIIRPAGSSHSWWYAGVSVNRVWVWEKACIRNPVRAAKKARKMTAQYNKAARLLNG